MTLALSLTDVNWPAAEALPADRVISGTPEASTLVLREDSRSEFGLWMCTPGAFSTVRDGYSEYIHIISGSGELIGDDGKTYELKPGLIISLDDGWSGRWVITEAVTKSYAIAHTAS